MINKPWVRFVRCSIAINTYIYRLEDDGGGGGVGKREVNEIFPSLSSHLLPLID